MSEEDVIKEDPILVRSNHITAGAAPPPIHVVVVGAGGTGGRLIAPLMQVLKRGDSVAIVDGDHVEDRNLVRQNFKVRDIGENKAEVLARRYRRDGIEMSAYATMFEKSIWRHFLMCSERNDHRRFIIIGCVDNPKARAEMNWVATQDSVSMIWIDGGNEMRGGQVILSARTWPFEVSGMIPVKGGDAVWQKKIGNFSIAGMQAMPQLLKVQKAEQEACGERIDLQTVAVNQLSATCILNMLACVLHGVPFSNAGAFFSTLNTMSPIRLKTVKWDTQTIMPETTYADND